MDKRCGFLYLESSSGGVWSYNKALDNSSPNRTDRYDTAGIRFMSGRKKNTIIREDKKILRSIFGDGRRRKPKKGLSQSQDRLDGRRTSEANVWVVIKAGGRSMSLDATKTSQRDSKHSKGNGHWLPACPVNWLDGGNKRERHSEALIHPNYLHGNKICHRQIIRPSLYPEHCPSSWMLSGDMQRWTV